jgi:hypothetical protein
VHFVEAENGNVLSDGRIQDAHRVPLLQTDKLPLWRIVVSSNLENQQQGTMSSPSKATKDLSFSVGFFPHHAICDGLSCGAFHISFISALNTFISKQGKAPIPSAKSILSNPNLPLLPPIELATPLPITTWYILKQIFTNFIYKPVSPLIWSGPPVLPASKIQAPPLCNLKSFFIAGPLVNALVKLCRDQKTTLTSLVTVLTAQHLSEMYPTHSRFAGTVPFSLRKFTNVLPKEMCVYVSNVVPNFSSESKTPKGYISCRAAVGAESVDRKVDNRELWDSARACRAFIADATASPADQAVGTLSYVKDLAAFFKGQLGQPRKYAFEVTNIGVIDGNATSHREKEARFERMVFSTALNTVGEPFCICMATAKGGDMCLSINWEEGVVSREDALGLGESLEESLTELAVGA